MCIRCAIFHGSFPYQGDLFLPDDLLAAQFEECVFRRPRGRQAISLWPVIIEVRLQGAVQRHGDEAEAGGCRRPPRIDRSPACPRTLPRRPERPVGTGDSDIVSGCRPMATGLGHQARPARTIRELAKSTAKQATKGLSAKAGRSVASIWPGARGEELGKGLAVALALGAALALDILVMQLVPSTLAPRRSCSSWFSGSCPLSCRSIARCAGRPYRRSHGATPALPASGPAWLL